MSIKDPTYHLPVVWPERFVREMSSGANKPILVSGIEDGDEQRWGDYVVKLMASERMSTSACMREVLACFMAREMDIPVVNPVLVNIENDFVETVRGKDCYQRMSNSLGINFGSRHLGSAYQTFATHQPLNESQRSYATDIFWFDMLIENPDRTFIKPNMLSNGREIAIYDHELAFSFLFLLFPDQRPWEVTREKWPHFGDLVLPGKLKGVKFEKDSIAGKLNRLDEEFWKRAVSLIPVDWKDETSLNKIRTHVDLIQQNVADFVKHLQTIIS